jgi:hypothetical protein
VNLAGKRRPKWTEKFLFGGSQGYDASTSEAFRTVSVQKYAYVVLTINGRLTGPRYAGATKDERRYIQRKLVKDKRSGPQFLITLPLTLSGDVSHPYHSLRYGRARRAKREKGNQSNRREASRR